jgi:hypothetical protein
MFIPLTNSQNLADRIKGFVLNAHVSTSALQRVVLRTIAEFEKAQWIPLAMEDALKRYPELTIKPDTGLTFEGSDDDALAAIDGVLREYFALIDPTAQEFTADQAAEYLEISREQFNTYASRQKRISGRKVGTSVLYSQAELDRFKAERKPMGRPKSKAESDI